MEKLEDVKREYWKVLAHTRKSGRISRGVVEKTEEKWSAYDEDIIVEALRIHMSRTPGYKENYTVGIMRNLQKAKDNGQGMKKNKYGDMMQREYDFETLERELLDN